MLGSAADFVSFAFIIYSTVLSNFMFFSSSMPLQNFLIYGVLLLDQISKILIFHRCHMIFYVNFKGHFYLCTPHRHTILCVHSPPKFQIVFNLNNHQCFKSFLLHVLKKTHDNCIKLPVSPEFVFSFPKCNHYL